MDLISSICFWTIWNDSNLDDVSVVEYADDSTILDIVNESLDNSEKVLTQFMDWTNNNKMKYG